MKYIIRDHDRKKFEEKKAYLASSCGFINARYGQEVLKWQITDTYYNMRALVEKEIHIVDRVKKAMEDEGVTPVIKPIRGGTDGARLSYMGLLCPNICTGGENYHGKYEFIAVSALEKVSDILFRICVNAASENAPVYGHESENDGERRRA